MAVAAVQREDAAFALAIPSLPPDGAPEPRIAAIARAGEPGAPARLDPRRATTGGPARPVRSAPRTLLPYALLGSIALHLLPLAALVDRRAPPAPAPAPIPVTLVVVPPPLPQPKPKPPPPPRETKRPPPGRLASEDMGSPSGQRHGTAGEHAAPAAAHPAPPTELVSDLPPPQPAAVALPLPDAPPTQTAMLPPPPKPPAPAPRRRPRLPPVRRLSGAWPIAPAHLGAPGPAATRDAYLAYCNEMIRRHFDMLPASFIAGRRGLTQLSLTVLDDGRVAQISVTHSSGYPDIDERVEQMVRAAGRFPPLPQWYQGTRMMLLYDLPFPFALTRR